MGNSFHIYSFFTLLGCLVTGAAVAWLLYGKTSALTRSLRITLAIIRASAITLILWLLFAPLVQRVSYTLEKPIVIIAQDNSASIAAVEPAQFNAAVYAKDLKELSKELAEQYEVISYSFSDQVSAGLDFTYKGKLTNASLLASQLNDKLQNRNVGAVILATDGIFNRGGNPASQFEALKAPVYTIALGDTIPKKDLLITNLTSSELVYLDNDFKIEVQVQAYQCNGAQTTLQVTEDGKVVHEQQLKLDKDVFTKTIPVQLKASKLGQHLYTVTLSALNKEISTKNNTQQTIVEVIDDRQKVLIAAAGPHPDLAALKQAIALNKHFEPIVVLNDELLKIDPKNYGLIILYQLPGIQFNAKPLLDKIQQSKAAVWYILGAQSNISQFNQLQTQVNLTGNNGTLQYVYSDISSNLSAFDLDPAFRKMIGTFDPLQAPTGQLKVSGNTIPVFDQRLSQQKRGALQQTAAPQQNATPQLFFMNDNSRKTAYLIGEGFWKWKLAEAKESDDNTVFNGLITKVVQYLSVKDDKRKFVVYPAKTPFEENEPVLLNATLYNDSYLPVNTAEVTLKLKDEKGKIYNFSFSKYESGYQLNAGILPPGKYSYTANTSLGNQKYEMSGSFFVNALQAEFQQTIANHQLLYNLSAQTNGKMFTPANLSAIKQELQKSGQLKTLSYEDRKYEELINLKWLFALILLLLSTEWFIRKRNAVR